MVKDVFLARQPIFDIKQRVYAYEILFRSGDTSSFEGMDGDEASSQVIINTFQTFGIENLTNKKPVFVNFTDNLINEEIATLFPKDLLVIEVLETVTPSKEVIESCKALKDMGYIIALDDFVYKEEYDPLVEIADIIKIDFLNSSIEEIEAITNMLKDKNIVFLAEKVETHEDFEIAKNLGFSLFQGFFFSKPETLTSNTLQPIKLNYLHLINKLNDEEINFSEVSEIISRDISMTYSILKLVNSAAFGFRREINSVKEAVVILGEREIRKWLTLLALNGLGSDKPDEVIRLSLIRAKFAETLAYKTKFRNRAEDVFLAGLFSLIDVILNRSLEEVLEDIKLPEDVRRCLLNEGSELTHISNIVLNYEKGNWEEVEFYADILEIDDAEIIDAYISTLLWYSKFMQT